MRHDASSSDVCVLKRFAGLPHQCCCSRFIASLCTLMTPDYYMMPVSHPCSCLTRGELHCCCRVTTLIQCLAKVSQQQLDQQLDKQVWSQLATKLVLLQLMES